MGNIISEQRRSARNENDSANLRRNTTKRKRNRDDTGSGTDDSELGDQDTENTNSFICSPKRRKLLTTSEYIYKTLYKEGVGTDIEVSALGKLWKLHKVHLCQARYFDSMFNRTWQESDSSFIAIDIPDPAITIKALDIVFGSLYLDSVQIAPVDVVSVLAAATLLGQDGLIQQCCAIMEETLHSKTVSSYYEACQMYGQPEVSMKCCKWLQHNLMVSGMDTEFIQTIGVDLMSAVVASPDLLVIQVEMDVYTLLKKWVFLRQHQSWRGSVKELNADMERFYSESYDTHNMVYVETEEGREFQPVFRELRLHSICNDLSSLKGLDSDHIIPKEWLTQLYEVLWKHMLKVDTGSIKHPLDISNFQQSCMRLGRVLEKDRPYCWRWVGFNHGIDLLISISKRLVLLKRNVQTHTIPSAVSLVNERPIAYKITVIGLNENGQTTFRKSTGLISTKLPKDEDIVAMNIGHKVTFPMYFSGNFLFASPAHLTTNTLGAANLRAAQHSDESAATSHSSNAQEQEAVPGPSGAAT